MYRELIESKLKRREFYGLLEERNQIMRNIVETRKQTFDRDHPKDILDEFLLDNMDDTAVVSTVIPDLT